MQDKYDSVAKLIIEKTGSKNNIRSLSYRRTRLYIEVFDAGRIDKRALKCSHGIVTVEEKEGRWEIVIGSQAADVYHAMNKITPFPTKSQADKEEKEKHKESCIRILSDIFMPLIGILAAAGILKGILEIVLYAGWVSEAAWGYRVFMAAAEGIYRYLPVIVAIQSARRFKTNQFTAAVIGAMSCYTDLFPNTAGMIPVIFLVYLAGRLEQLLAGKLQEQKGFLIPMLVLPVMIPVTGIVLGIVNHYLGVLLSALIRGIYRIPAAGGILGGAVLAGIWQILVLFGLHWGILEDSMAEVSASGFTYLLTPVLVCSFAQGFAALACIIREQNKIVRANGIASFTAALFGVTKPAVLGFTLPGKQVFVTACAASAAGGGFIGLMQARTFKINQMGLLGYFDVISGGNGKYYSLIWVGIGIIAAAAIAFIVTYLFNIEER